MYSARCYILKYSDLQYKQIVSCSFKNSEAQKKVRIRLKKRYTDRNTKLGIALFFYSFLGITFCTVWREDEIECFGGSFVGQRFVDGIGAADDYRQYFVVVPAFVSGGFRRSGLLQRIYQVSVAVYIF